MNESRLPPGFSGDDAAALPLHLLRRDTLASWRDAQPEAVGAWLDAHGFDAAPGTMLPLPADDGRVAGALLGIGDPLDPFSYAHGPAGLPGDAWRVAGDHSDAERRALQLGWGLGAYRFDRYKARPRGPAKLAGSHDAATFDLLAACVRVRDLVNTPSQDMGPEQLEDVARGIAEHHGARFEAITGDDLLARHYAEAPHHAGSGGDAHVHKRRSAPVASRRGR